MNNFIIFNNIFIMYNHYIFNIISILPLQYITFSMINKSFKCLFSISITSNYKLCDIITHFFIMLNIIVEKHYFLFTTPIHSLQFLYYSKKL